MDMERLYKVHRKSWFVSCGFKRSGFMPKHMEQPGSRQSNPALFQENGEQEVKCSGQVFKEHKLTIVPFYFLRV